MLYEEGDLYAALETSTPTGTFVSSSIVDAVLPNGYPPAFTYMTSGNHAQNTTVYAGGYASSAGSSVTESEVQFPMPACTVKNLRVCVSATVSATTTVLTIRKNGADTGVTATLTTSGRIVSDLVNTVAFAAGDLISVKIVSGATTGTRNYNVTFEMVA